MYIPQAIRPNFLYINIYIYIVGGHKSNLQKVTSEFANDLILGGGFNLLFYRAIWLPSGKLT